MQPFGVAEFASALRKHNVPLKAIQNPLRKMLFTVPRKLSYQTAAEESYDQASSSVKPLIKLLVKGIGVFSSGEEDIKDHSFL
uniref:Uncharacterized protein n=1 Tax=Romanomermis culicivorax TaxID=13658 RepID=A0A915L096_ROMCU